MSLLWWGLFASGVCLLVGLDLYRRRSYRATRPVDSPSAAIEPLITMAPGVFVAPARPRIAFCTTCKGRTQHLEKTLPRNLADAADYPNCVFVVLDYGSPDHLRKYLGAHHSRDIASGKLVVYSFSATGPFHMAHAKNMAHRCGMMEGADILVNLDADNFTGPGFATWIASRFPSKREKVFLWANMVKTGKDKTPRGISGRIVVTANAFVLAGGYDEQYDTWGPDDKDFNLRLRRLGFEGQEIPRGFLGAVLHTDRMRFREYMHVAQSNAEDVVKAPEGDSEATIANYGRIGLGRVYRNYTRPVDIEPLPTRLFGIGMHKTATTSLHAALQLLLGYDSAHWGNAHWAKSIWTEMKADGRSITAEKHYALCDLPITLLYRELDRAYPGSKFILTVRDESAWIESVRNHWDRNANPFREAWDTDPFSHKIHQALYGRRTFDEFAFRERYRRHNAEVIKYFRDRPDDLLVMDMDAGAGWSELCSFIGRPVPPCEYPRQLMTKANTPNVDLGAGI